MSGRARRPMRPRGPLSAVALAGALITASTATGAPAAGARTLYVQAPGAAAAASAPAPSRAAKRAPFSTIQSAVDRARPGDWVVIGRGVYRGSVQVRTPGIHIRGVDRNAVIIDGEHRPGDGIEVRRPRVSVENLTVRNFGQRRDGSGGAQVLFMSLTGWKADYLTTYDDGLDGAAGIEVATAGHGSLDHSYASGFGVAGVLVSGCRDCAAQIQHVTAENNAVGLALVNAGGHLAVQHAILRGNATGLAALSRSHGYGTPPQDGSCYVKANKLAAPVVLSTAVSRCTIVRNVAAVANNSLTAPRSPFALPLPWGVGLAWAGAYADLVTASIASGNAGFGIVAYEAPDPAPPASASVHFESAGNSFRGDTAVRNGQSDMALEGGAFGHGSINDCFSQDRLVTSIPDGLQSGWGCQNKHTPVGTSSLVPTLTALQFIAAARTPAPQPPPAHQQTMPHPCSGPPPSSVCR